MFRVELGAGGTRLSEAALPACGGRRTVSRGHTQLQEGRCRRAQAAEGVPSAERLPSLGFAKGAFSRAGSHRLCLAFGTRSGSLAAVPSSPLCC